MSNEVIEIHKAIDWGNRRRVFLGVGLQLPAIMTRHEHSLVGVYLGQAGDAGAWGRGDHVNRVRDEVRKMADKFKWSQTQYNRELAARYAELVSLYRSVSIKTILNNATTAAAWPLDTRRQTQVIGYAHHEALNKYDPIVRDAYLNRAQRERWTVATLRKALANPEAYFGQEVAQIEVVA